MIKIQPIFISNPLYQQERQLRNEVLLRPIGLPDHAWEMKDDIAWHIVALENEKVIGCVLLAPLNEENSEAQLMQMAVHPDFQRKGIGKLLVEEVLNIARENSISSVKCHSRAKAVDFYLKMGFNIYGEPFEEVGVMHRYMRIFLT